jgi:hypothetical protein
VAKTVVDDLEPIQIQVEHREPRVEPAAPALVEPAAEALDEHGAVRQTGERVNEPDATKPLLRNRMFGGVGERPRDPIGFARRVPHAHAAAKKLAVGAVLVPDPVLVLKNRGRARQVSGERGVEIVDVVGMDAVQPFRRPGDRCTGGHPDHGAPPPGDVKLLRLQVPLPQAIVRAFCGKRQAVAAVPDLLLHAHTVGDVLPHQRQALGHRHDLDLDDAQTRTSGRQPQMIQRPHLPVRERLPHGCGKFGAGQRGYDVGNETTERPVRGPLQEAFERIVPVRDTPVAIDDRQPLFEVIEHLAPPMLFLDSPHIVGIGAVREEQHCRDHGGEAPEATVDDRDDHGRDTRAKQVQRTTVERARRPRSIDGPTCDERHDDAREAALHDLIRDDRGSNGHGQPRCVERERGAGRLVGEARTPCRRRDDPGVDERLGTERAATHQPRHDR